MYKYTRTQRGVLFSSGIILGFWTLISEYSKTICLSEANGGLICVTDDIIETGEDTHERA